MDKDQSKKSDLEGEGSYTATRNYNKHLAEALDSGDIEAAADAARRAVEGPEGEELARAAEEAKHGPKHPPAIPHRARPIRPV
ncbi:MAG: hypothetical protein ABI548_20880 [Polyangiaceae bacterium]